MSDLDLAIQLRKAGTELLLRAGGLTEAYHRGFAPEQRDLDHVAEIVENAAAALRGHELAKVTARLTPAIRLVCGKRFGEE